MSDAHFEFLRQFIAQNSAIIIEPEKQYLIETRLQPVARELGFESIIALINELMKNQHAEKIKHKIIDAMTTNETFFFRDKHPFDLLNNHIIPDLIEHNKTTRTLNIWCAAASSGQEPYTIAMVLKDNHAKLNGWTINFHATDISEKMLEKCQAGIYSQLELNRGLPLAYLVKYFEKNGANWQVKKELRDMIKFYKLNLMNPWSIRDIDVIFIRNVLIYFSVERKRDILQRMEKTLNPQGYLFLGGSETMLGLTERFTRMRINDVTCYQHTSTVNDSRA